MSVSTVRSHSTPNSSTWMPARPGISNSSRRVRSVARQSSQAVLEARVPVEVRHLSSGGSVKVTWYGVLSGSVDAPGTRSRALVVVIPLLLFRDQHLDPSLLQGRPVRGAIPLSVTNVCTSSSPRNITSPSLLILELSASTMTWRAFAATCFFTGTSSTLDCEMPSFRSIPSPPGRLL